METVEAELIRTDAVLSDCKTWRYRLEREYKNPGILYAFFGVNPSTAEAAIEDATTKKWRGFTLRNGGRGYIAANPFAFRATDVKALASAKDPIGPDNDAHILRITKEADILVPCWGSRDKLPFHLQYRLDALLRTLRASGKPVMIFGKAKSGDPLHPLMLSYETRLVNY